jgi:hypothetical protein
VNAVQEQAQLFAQALVGDPLRGAVFSECRTYRYRLWEIWDRTKPIVLYVMLNPSTADEVKNDPTVERCARRARQLGAGGFRIANIFALRSTDPDALYSHSSPVDEHHGKTNDVHIRVAAKASNLVICGWGEHGAFNGRGATVLHNLRMEGIKPHALRMNKSGQPGHPLYIPYSAKPFEVPHA